MKTKNCRVSKRLVCLFLVLCLLISLFAVLLTRIFAAPPLPEANSKPRHVVCTALSDAAKSYYTGSYSYATLSALPGAADSTDSWSAQQNNALYTALQTKMSATQSYNSSYSGSNAGSLAYYWARTDAVNGGSSYIMFYSDVAPDGYTMNREHVWPKSRASYYQKNGGSDLHHLRPSVQGLNSAKSNHRFGNIVGNYTGYKSGQVGGVTCYWTYSAGDLFECKDDVKGDVARILLYVYCRWGQPNLYSDVSGDKLPPLDPDDKDNTGVRVIESLDTLLSWCEQDPVDTWEMARNDLVQQVQGNRNVFIDYPELAWLMFGRQVPETAQTPLYASCEHSWQLQAVEAAGCTEDGLARYVCEGCGRTRTETMTAKGHQWDDGQVTTEPTEQTEGTRTYTCTVCGQTRTESIPVLTHVHSYTATVTAPTCTEQGYTTYTCACGVQYVDAYIPALGHSYVDGVCTICGEPDPAPGDPFTDVLGTDYFYVPVLWAAHSQPQITAGTDATHFSPQETCTRGQIVTFLWRANGCPAVGSADTQFTDISPTDYYYAAVLWAVEQGITNGTDATHFSPKNSCTRAQAVTFLWRAQAEPEAGSAQDVPFADVQPGSYYYTAVLWAVEQGVTNGTGPTRFSPEAVCTRGQIVTFLYRAMN